MVENLEIMVMIQRVTFILLCAVPESQFDRHKPFEGCLTFMKVFFKCKVKATFKSTFTSSAF